MGEEGEAEEVEEGAKEEAEGEEDNIKLMAFKKFMYIYYRI